MQMEAILLPVQRDCLLDYSYYDCFQLYENMLLGVRCETLHLPSEIKFRLTTEGLMDSQLAKLGKKGILLFLLFITTKTVVIKLHGYDLLLQPLSAFFQYN